MERNLRIYPVYRAARAALFWVPVFFLYFSSTVTIDQVLLLESIYYFSVVILELPSGYFSDRIGRRPTLILSALAGVGSYSLFYLGGQTETAFGMFAAAQFLFAICKSFNSGTDSSLLFDSLLELNKENELLKREASAQAGGYVVAASSAVLGGLIGSQSLALPYAVSAVVAVVALLCAFLFVEPPLKKTIAINPGSALRIVATHIRTPVLGWVFAAAVAMTVFEHVPYEFVQPYLELLFGGKQDNTPITSGVLFGGTLVLAAVASSLLARRTRSPKVRVLLFCLVGTAAVAGTMASALSWWILPIFALRSLPSAVANPVISAAIHPRIPSEIRASYLSVQSLCGRLAFAGSLALASLGFDSTHTTTFGELQNVLLLFLGANLVVVLGLALVKRPEAQ